MKRLLLFILLSLLVADQAKANNWMWFANGSVPATGSCSGDIGDKTCTGTVSPSASGMAYICEITADCTGTLTAIGATLRDIESSSSRWVYLLLYDSDAADDGGPSGEPWTRLAYDGPYGDDATASTWTAVERTISRAVNSGHKVWAGVLFNSTSSDYQNETSGGTCRYVNLGFSTPPAAWPYATDSASTQRREFWLSYD